MEFRSGDALFAFDGDMTVLSWNHAAEELTGIPAARRARQAVLGGARRRRRARLARLPPRLLGRPARRRGLAGALPAAATSRPARADAGVCVSTIAVRNGDGPVYVHLLRNGAESQPIGEPPPGSRHG